MIKAVVIGLWGKGRGAAGAGRQCRQLQQIALRMLGQFQLTAGRAGQMLGPVAPGLDEGMGGHAARKPGHGRARAARSKLLMRMLWSDAADRSLPEVRRLTGGTAGEVSGFFLVRVILASFLLDGGVPQLALRSLLQRRIIMALSQVIPSTRAGSAFRFRSVAKKAAPTATINSPSISGTGLVPSTACKGGR